MDASEITRAFDEMLDQALLFHGFAEHMRDYDLYIYATADPSTGIQPEQVRYRFLDCVLANVTTTVRDDVWPKSLDDRLTDYQAATESDLEGYVWGVNWQLLYPGMSLVSDSPIAKEWSERLGMELHEAVVQGNAHRIELIFADLDVGNVPGGTAPFTVPAQLQGGPDAKWYFTE